jgi:hypothetical protein
MCIHELFLATFLSYPQNNPSSHQHLTAANLAKSAAAPFMDLAKQFVMSQPTPALSPAARAAGMYEVRRRGRGRGEGEQRGGEQRGGEQRGGEQRGGEKRGRGEEREKGG